MMQDVDLSMRRTMVRVGNRDLTEMSARARAQVRAGGGRTYGKRPGKRFAAVGFARPCQTSDHRHNGDSAREHQRMAHGRARCDDRARAPARASVGPSAFVAYRTH